MIDSEIWRSCVSSCMVSFCGYCASASNIFSSLLGNVMWDCLKIHQFVGTMDPHWRQVAILVLRRKYGFKCHSGPMCYHGPTSLLWPNVATLALSAILVLSHIATLYALLWFDTVLWLYVANLALCATLGRLAPACGDKSRLVFWSLLEPDGVGSCWIC